MPIPESYRRSPTTPADTALAIERLRLRYRRGGLWSLIVLGFVIALAFSGGGHSQTWYGILAIACFIYGAARVGSTKASAVDAGHDDSIQPASHYWGIALRSLIRGVVRGALVALAIVLVALLIALVFPHAVEPAIHNQFGMGGQPGVTTSIEA